MARSAFFWDNNVNNRGGSGAQSRATTIALSNTLQVGRGGHLRLSG